MLTLEKALRELVARSNSDPRLKIPELATEPIQITTYPRFSGYFVWSTSPVSQSTRTFQIAYETDEYHYKQGTEVQKYKTQKQLLRRMHRELYRL